MATLEEVKQEQAADLEIHSSVSDFKELMSSHVWQDMLRYVNMKNEASSREIIYAEDSDNIRVLQGRLQAGQEMAQLPEILIQLIEGEQDNERR